MTRDKRRDALELIALAAGWAACGAAWAMVWCGRG